MDEFTVNAHASELVIEAVSTSLNESLQLDISSPCTKEVTRIGSEATSLSGSGSSASFRCAFKSSHSDAGPG